MLQLSFEVLSINLEITITSVWSHTTCSTQQLPMNSGQSQSATFSGNQSKLCYNQREIDTLTQTRESLSLPASNQNAFYTKYNLMPSDPSVEPEQGWAWPLYLFSFLQIIHIAHEVTRCWSLLQRSRGISSATNLSCNISNKRLFWRIKNGSLFQCLLYRHIIFFSSLFLYWLKRFVEPYNSVPLSCRCFF